MLGLTAEESDLDDLSDLDLAKHEKRGTNIQAGGATHRLTKEKEYQS